MITNYEQLVSRGNIEGRKVVLDIIEHALKQVNFYNLTKDFVQFREHLKIGPLEYDLDEIDELFVVGGGKQVTFVGAALEEVLGDRISEGVLVEKRGWGRSTRRIEIVEGGHPVPDFGSAQGAREILRIAEKAQEGDLVIACITGGCTSLTSLPPDGITLEETRRVFDLLLGCGAPVEEMNTVRKHLSKLAGGKLSKVIHPAETVALIAIDEVAGLPWGPTVPDTTSFSDAVDVLARYGLWDEVPESVRRYLRSADPLEETPKKTDFDRIGIRAHNLTFAENQMMCRAAEERATNLGLHAMTASSRIRGEARDVAAMFAGIAKEIERHSGPIESPCIILAGGETTASIKGEAGQGGRNQEFALAACLEIAGSENTVIASVGTDGNDGGTDVAGAVVDGYSLTNAVKAGIDPVESLQKHDSANVFRRLGDAICTGNTMTNLMDLVIVHVRD